MVFLLSVNCSVALLLMVLYTCTPRIIVVSVCYLQTFSCTRDKASEHRHRRRESNLLRCSDCGKRVSSLGALKRHVETLHMGQFRYSCAICGKGMRELRDLNGHMAFKHNMQKAYKCVVCDEEFGYKRNIAKHMMSKHGMEFK